MRGLAGKFEQSGGIVSVALALLLLFRLLIPSGYMIAPDRDGRPGLELCAAPARAAADAAINGGHDRHPADQAPAETRELPCAFAAPAAPPLPPEPPAVAPRSPAAAVPPDMPTGPSLVRVAPAAPRPPATGPPLPV
jgi:hypothetical protein